MPPADPRLRPSLEESPPGDAVPGGPYRFTGPWDVRLVLFGSGEWLPVSVRVWRKDRLGRDVVDVEWHAGSGAWSGSFVVDPEKMREPEG